MALTSGKGKEREKDGSGRGDFNIVTVKLALSVLFDKAVKGKGGAAGNAGVGAGKEGEVEEKKFLQK